MLALVNTNEKLQIVLGSAVTANQLHAIAHYSDNTGSDYVRKANRVLTNNTTDVDLIGSPAASTLRDVDSLNVYNRDTSAANVILKIDIAGTEYILGSWTLAPGDVLHYTHGSGWQTLDSMGRSKVTTSSITSNVDLYYEHDQSSPATTWNVNHTLGKRPSVSIVNGSGNLVLADVNYIDNNSLTVNFAVATTGKVYCN